MFGHYLTTALARFRSSPFTTAANVLTLALGLACFIAAYGVASYWRSGDSHHPGADRIFYIEQSFGPVSQGSLGRRAQTWTSVRLAADLRREIPELEAVARIDGANDERTAMALSSGETKLFLRRAGAEREIFGLLAFDFVEGAPETALAAPDDIVLTADAAQRMFGDSPALGRQLVLAGDRDVRVSGVIAPVREPSFLGHQLQSPVRFDMLTNLSAEFAEPPDNWGYIGGMTLVRLPPSMTVEAFQARLDDLAARASTEMDPRFTAQPIGRIVQTIVNAQFLANGAAGVSVSAILLCLGVLILFVACVNCANLAAAQVAKRLKEAGMRRVLGAGRRQILAQQLTESCLLAVPALVLAVGLVALAAPVFRTLVAVEVTHFLTAGPGGLFLLAGVSLASAAAVAIYPAFAVSRVRADAALGGGRDRIGAAAVSRILVGVQFFSASLLIIVVAVAQLQHAHLKAAAFGPDRDPVVMLDDYESLGVDFETFRTELMAAPQIRSVTATTVKPWTEAGYSLSVRFGRSRTQPPGEETYLVKAVGDAYFETFGRRILAGRVFDPDQDGAGGRFYFRARGEAPPDTPQPVVIDLRAARAQGFETPEAAVGQILYDYTLSGQDPAEVGRIIGVVEPDDPALATTYQGVFLEYDPDYTAAGLAAVRVDPSDIPGAVAHITQVWDALAPDIPARTDLAEDLFEQSYAPFRRIAATFAILSAGAFVIATAGLLAIAAPVTARRRREVGVRKVLGASTGRVLRLLVTDFSRPVVIGNLIAWPFAWMAAQAYLQSFAERTPLSPLPFIVSLAVTLAIAWLAVGGQAWRAASVKPASVLRYE